MIDAASYQIHALTSPDPFRQMVASVYHLYQKKLTAFNALDFGDLIMKSVELLRDTAATGNGANESGVFTTDITGATRTVPWDIGAFKATSTAVNHGFTRFLR